MSEKEVINNLDNLEKNRKKFSFKLASFINHILVRRPKLNT